MVLHDNGNTHLHVTVRSRDESRKGPVMSRSILRWLLLSLVVLTLAAASFGQIAVGVSVRIGPPPLPVYAQPICPGPGYFWTPGYWAWDDDDGYYWVPGTWVVAPVGMLWTPGYWGWNDGFYLWHGGYWGPHVGFYGGINYGFGYTGFGFGGGEWRGRSFYYNRSVTNVSVTNVTNVYNRTVIVNNNSRVAFNGRGGIEARPTRDQERFAHERHMDVLPSQREHERAAVRDRGNFARENHGRPAIAATERPGDFSRRSVVPARAAGGEYHAPAMSPREARGPANPGNRGGSNAAENRGRSNEGFRPFTPPAKGGPAANDRGGNSANRNEGRVNENRSNMRTNENRPSENRMNENRPNENRSNAGRTNENRPNENRMRPSPPSENRMNQSRQNDNRSNDRPNTRTNENRTNENRMRPSPPSENRMNQNRPNQNRSNQARPQNQPREAARPAQRENSRPAPAPRQQNAPPPKGDHNRGR